MNSSLRCIHIFLLLFSTASFGQNYVKVIERQSGKPLDSFMVSFYHVSGTEVDLQGETITDKNGIATIPESLNHCNEVMASPLREPLKYWPGIEYIDDSQDGILVIQVDIARVERWAQLSVYFEEKSTDLSDRYLRELGKWIPKISKILKEHPKYDLEIHSHADTHDEHHMARKIAGGRGDTVKEWLVKHKINPIQIVVINEEDKKPKVICKKGKDCSETDPENRRVDLKIIPIETE